MASDFMFNVLFGFHGSFESIARNIDCEHCFNCFQPFNSDISNLLHLFIIQGCVCIDAIFVLDVIKLLFFLVRFVGLGTVVLFFEDLFFCVKLEYYWYVFSV